MIIGSPVIFDKKTKFDHRIIGRQNHQNDHRIIGKQNHPNDHRIIGKTTLNRIIGNSAITETLLLGPLLEKLGPPHQS